MIPNAAKAAIRLALQSSRLSYKEGKTFFQGLVFAYVHDTETTSRFQRLNYIGKLKT